MYVYGNYVECLIRTILACPCTTFVILENPDDHSVIVARREAIGEWLRNVIRKTFVWEDTDMNYETKILLLLSGMYSL